MSSTIDDMKCALLECRATREEFRPGDMSQWLRTGDIMDVFEKREREYIEHVRETFSVEWVATGSVHSGTLVPEPCEHCGAEWSVVQWARQTRAADEEETPFFSCRACEKEWSR